MSSESDLHALVEACLSDGYSFGAISREIRSDFREAGNRDVGMGLAIEFTMIILESLHKAGNRQALDCACAWHTSVGRPYADWMKHNTVPAVGGEPACSHLT